MRFGYDHEYQWFLPRTGRCGCFRHGASVTKARVALARWERERGLMNGRFVAVETPTPGLTCGDVAEIIDRHLRSGVPLVWIFAPRFRTVTVYRPNAEPEFFNANEELTAEPHLPGIRVAVCDLFEES